MLIKFYSMNGREKTINKEKIEDYCDLIMSVNNELEEDDKLSGERKTYYDLLCLGLQNMSERGKRFYAHEAIQTLIYDGDNIVNKLPENHSLRDEHQTIRKSIENQIGDSFSKQPTFVYRPSYHDLISKK